MLGVAEETRHPPFALRTSDVRGSFAISLTHTPRLGRLQGANAKGKDGDEYLVFGVQRAGWVQAGRPTRENMTPERSDRLPGRAADPRDRVVRPASPAN